MRSFFFILNSRVQYVKIRKNCFHFQLNVICLVVDKIERQRIRKASQSYQGILTAGWFGYRKPKGSYNMGRGRCVVDRAPCRIRRRILISGIGYRRRTSVIAKTENPNLQDMGQSSNVDSTAQRVTWAVHHIFSFCFWLPSLAVPTHKRGSRFISFVSRNAPDYVRGFHISLRCSNFLSNRSSAVGLSKCCAILSSVCVKSLTKC